MQKLQPEQVTRKVRFGIVFAGLLCVSRTPCAAQMQTQTPLFADPDLVKKHISYKDVAGAFLGAGGYFFTDGSARRALGDVKFLGDTQLYVRPAHLGSLVLTGGLELLSASDHFLPFTGGNEFSLTGPSFRATMHRVLGQPRPYLTGGLFVGRVRSVGQGFDRSNFAPSLSLGVTYPFARYFTLVAGYRVSQHIHSIDTDGFSLELRVF